MNRAAESQESPEERVPGTAGGATMPSRHLLAPLRPRRCPRFRVLSPSMPGTRSTPARSWPSDTMTSRPWRTTTAQWPFRFSPSPSATSLPTCSQTGSSRSDRCAGPLTAGWGDDEHHHGAEPLAPVAGAPTRSWAHPSPTKASGTPRRGDPTACISHPTFHQIL